MLFFVQRIHWALHDLPKIRCGWTAGMDVSQSRSGFWISPEQRDTTTQSDSYSIKIVSLM
jgi:hypothetical protein